ncbi:hypothetical protein GCM10022255_088860 [Dactylosporangium darangshiense]|uniref:Uncharacterized protein n=1 Tax=Dactylosporangium darangshiense TaxID=579108 RepID=A0ABP8DNQ9_9ACTN
MRRPRARSDGAAAGGSAERVESVAEVVGPERLAAASEEHLAEDARRLRGCLIVVSPLRVVGSTSRGAGVPLWDLSGSLGKLGRGTGVGPDHEDRETDFMLGECVGR